MAASSNFLLKLLLEKCGKGSHLLKLYYDVDHELWHTFVRSKQSALHFGHQSLLGSPCQSAHFDWHDSIRFDRYCLVVRSGYSVLVWDGTHPRQVLGNSFCSRNRHDLSRRGPKMDYPVLSKLFCCTCCMVVFIIESFLHSLDAYYL